MFKNVQEVLEDENNILKGKIDTQTSKLQELMNMKNNEETNNIQDLHDQIDKLKEEMRQNMEEKEAIQEIMKKCSDSNESDLIIGQMVRETFGKDQYKGKFKGDMITKQTTQISSEDTSIEYSMMSSEFDEISTIGASRKFTKIKAF